MSLSEYLKTRLEYAAMPMQFQAPGSAVAQFDSWDFNLKTATIFSLFDKSAFTPAPRFKLNLGYPRFKCEMVADIVNFKCEMVAASNILKSRSFPLWQLRLPEQGSEAFLVFQKLLLPVNSKLTSRSQCEAFLQMESHLSRAKTFHCIAAFAKYVYLPDMIVAACTQHILLIHKTIISLF